MAGHRAGHPWRQPATTNVWDMPRHHEAATVRKKGRRYMDQTEQCMALSSLAAPRR
jgi:hypothetical protein